MGNNSSISKLRTKSFQILRGTNSSSPTDGRYSSENSTEPVENGLPGIMKSYQQTREPSLRTPRQSEQRSLSPPPKGSASPETNDQGENKDGGIQSHLTISAPSYRNPSPGQQSDSLKGYIFQDIPMSCQLGGAQDTPHMIEEHSAFDTPDANSSAKRTADQSEAFSFSVRGRSRSSSLRSPLVSALDPVPETTGPEKGTGCNGPVMNQGTSKSRKLEDDFLVDSEEDNETAKNIAASVNQVVLNLNNSEDNFLVDSEDDDQSGSTKDSKPQLRVWKNLKVQNSERMVSNFLEDSSDEEAHGAPCPSKEKASDFLKDSDDEDEEEGQSKNNLTIQQQDPNFKTPPKQRRPSISSASSQASSLQSFQSTKAKRGSLAVGSLSTQREPSYSLSSNTSTPVLSPVFCPNLSASDSSSEESFGSGDDVCDFADEIQVSKEEMEEVPELYMSQSCHQGEEEETNLPEEVRLRQALQKTQNLHFGLQTESAQDLMVASLHPKIYQPGETILQEGEESEDFYLVIGPRDAEVEVFAKERSLCRLGVGKYFGERTLVYGHGRTRNATIKAAADSPAVEVVSIGPKDFVHWEDFRRYLLIRQVPFLVKLPPEEQRHISQILHHETFHDGDYIVKQGDLGDKFYMIIKGEAKVLQKLDESLGTEATKAEPPKLITSLYEGNFFGELSLLLNQPRNASVVAQGTVNCVYITKDDFKEALSASEFQKFMEKHTGSLLRKIEQRKDLQLQRETSRRLSASGRRRRSRRSSAEGLVRESFITTHHLVKGRLSTGEQCVNKYMVIGELGRGQYGIVYKVKHTESNEIFAMKALDLKSNKNRKDIIAESTRREIAVMKKLRHRNLVAVWEAIADPSSSQVYIIQEFVHQGPLMTESFNCDALPTSKCRRYFRDVLNGLAFLHSYNVVHGDIKPANLLLAADNTVKIADFGSAIMRDASDEDTFKTNRYATSLFGTPAYMAPELFSAERAKVKEVLKAWTDLWSVGVTLFQMITGFLPFSAGNELELAHKVMHLQPEFPEDMAWEPSLRNLVNRLLEKNPKDRIPMKEILEHEWVTYDGLEPMEAFDDEEFLTLEVTEDDLHGALSQDTRDAAKSHSPIPEIQKVLDDSESDSGGG